MLKEDKPQDKLYITYEDKPQVKCTYYKKINHRLSVHTTRR